MKQWKIENQENNGREAKREKIAEQEDIVKDCFVFSTAPYVLLPREFIINIYIDL